MWDGGGGEGLGGGYRTFQERVFNAGKERLGYLPPKTGSRCLDDRLEIWTVRLSSRTFCQIKPPLFRVLFHLLIHSASVYSWELPFFLI